MSASSAQSMPATAANSPVAPSPVAPAPIEVSVANLPLSCPLPGASVWNMHPQVYLPIEATGAATCPYCGARYLLKR